MRTGSVFGVHVKAIYALHKTVVEPVFGQIKAARGIDLFL